MHTNLKGNGSHANRVQTLSPIIRVTLGRSVIRVYLCPFVVKKDLEKALFTVP